MRMMIGTGGGRNTNNEFGSSMSPWKLLRALINRLKFPNVKPCKAKGRVARLPTSIVVINHQHMGKLSFEIREPRAVACDELIEGNGRD